MDSDFLLKHKKTIAYAVLFIIILSVGTSLLSVVPGPEGVRAVNYAVQFGASGSVLVGPGRRDSLPPGFEWGSDQPSVMSVKHLKGDLWGDLVVVTGGEPEGGFLLNGPGWWYENDDGEVICEIQRPRLRDDPLGIEITPLEYYRYVQKSDTEVEIRKISCTVVPVDFVFQIAAVPKKGVYTWKDLRMWMVLDTVTWQNAYTQSPPPDPNPLTNSTVKYLSGNYRGAFPVVAWVGKYEDWVFTDEKGRARSDPPNDDAKNYVEVFPSLEGRFIDLYTSADTEYDLLFQSELQNEAFAKEALEPNWLPDPRFAETVYTYFTLSNFGAYVEPTGWPAQFSSYDIWYPSIYYRVRLLYAVYGEHVYLWTTQEAEKFGYTDETWEVRETQKESYVDPLTALFRGISDWLAKPFNLLGLSTFALIAIAAVTMIVLFWFFGRPKGRREKG